MFGLLRKVELQVAKWLKFMPSMPTELQKWLSGIMWIVAGAGVVVSFIMILTITGFYSFDSLFVGPNVTVSVEKGVALESVVPLLEMILVTSLLVAAFGPLKRHERDGWDKLFMVAIVSLISCLLQFTYFLDLYNLVTGIVWFFIETYFLIQVRNHFIRG